MHCAPGRLGLAVVAAPQPLVDRAADRDVAALGPATGSSRGAWRRPPWQDRLALPPHTILGRSIQFGLVTIRFDPHPEHRSRSATSGTARSAGIASQFTTARS